MTDFFHYHEKTPDDLKKFIESNVGVGRQRKTRLRFFYGNQETGELWGDHEDGYIGRSTGVQRIPLVINNQRSMGGGALLDHCIVAICETKKPEKWLWVCEAVWKNDYESYMSIHLAARKSQ